MYELKLKARNAWHAAIAMTAIAAILAFATVMTVSAQSDERDWKQSPTGLNATAGDQAGELAIAWAPIRKPAKRCPITASPGRQTASPSAQIQKLNGTPTRPPTK